MIEHRTSNPNLAAGISLMLSAALFMALVALFGKQLTGMVGVSGAIFLRFFLPFLILAWVTLFIFDERLQFGDWKLHAARAFFALSSQYCLFYYLGHGSLLLGTLLFATSGLFLPFVTYVAFKTKIDRRTLVAIIISFVGLAIVLKPTVDFEWVMLVGLLSGLLNAGSQATMHRLSSQTSTLAEVLTMFGLCSVGALAIVGVLGDWNELLPLASLGHPSSAHFLVISMAVAIVTISNQSMRDKAYRFVRKPASLSPFYYASVVFAGALDWLVYGVSPALHVYLGAALILAGGIIKAWPGAKPASLGARAA